MEKDLYAFKYVELKNREYQRKHSKQRHLGDIDGRYRYQPRSFTPTLIGSLVNLELPENRAINTNTAKAIIVNQTKQIHATYEKTNRAARLDAWSYPPLCDETSVVVNQRPHTAGAYERESSRTTKLAPRPFSTGSPGQRVHPHTPPQLQTYMVAKLKRRHNSVKKVPLKTLTTTLQAQWDDRKETQSPRRIKSQNAKRFDSFAGQWLSFAGGTQDEENGGVLDAFTGDAADEYYNVESCIGANIATQLNEGNKIRVGKNGVLQSNSLKVHKWKNEIHQDSFGSVPSDNLTSNLSSTSDRKPDSAVMVPLSWDDQLDQPDVKVVDIKQNKSVPLKQDLCERHPVVFRKDSKNINLPRHKVKLDASYQVRQCTKTKHNIDGTESLNNRITMITVDEIKDDQDSMCSEEYDELLHRSLQTADVDQIEAQPDLKVNIIENRPIDQGQFKFSPPTSSLPSESKLHPFVADKSPSQSPTLPMGLRNSNVSLEDYMKPKSPTREMSGASTPQQYHYSPSNPRQIARPVSRTLMCSKSAQTRSPKQAKVPKRAQSSPPRHKKHQFDEPVTPRNINSPRSNLVKPGQLPRSGVASIKVSSGQDREQEYIKISQQILPPSKNRNYSALACVSDDQHDEKEQSLFFDRRERNPESDIVSIDYMNVNKSKSEHNTGEHDSHTDDCTCSPEIKRVLSAALSHLSHTSEPTAVINIPTAGKTETDVHPTSSSVSFYSDKSDPLEGLESPPDSGMQTTTKHDQEQTQPSFENELPEGDQITNDQIVNDATGSCHFPDSTELSQKQEVGFFINQIDGLHFDQKDIELIENVPSRSHSAGKKKRSVKFADEQGSVSVPHCSPISTPRECNSDSEMAN